MKNLLVIAAIVLSGCATVFEPVSTGPGTYMVAAEGVMGNSSSGKQLFKAQTDASNFCSKQGKQVETVSTNEVPGGFGKVASATVNFKCIKVQ